MAKKSTITITSSGDNLQYETNNSSLLDMYEIACYATARYILQALVLGVSKETVKEQIEKLPIVAAKVSLKLKEEDEESEK